jgi:hypothetical protein
VAWFCQLKRSRVATGTVVVGATRVTRSWPYQHRRDTRRARRCLPIVRRSVTPRRGTDPAPDIPKDFRSEPTIRLSYSNWQAH